MAKWTERFCSLLLSLAVGFAPTVQADSSLQNINISQVMASESVEYLRLADQKKYGASSAELAAKAARYRFVKGTIVQSLEAVAGDVIQMSIIMAATATAQLVKERMERKQLLGAYTPKHEEVKEEAMKAAEDLICGNNPKNASVAGEVLCSGEFWTGVAGGFALRAGIGAVTTVLKFLTKNNATRSALIATVGTFATSFIMIAGFTAAGHIWTQAVHVMNDKDKEERAHNLFGRLMNHWYQGDWEEYVKTPDGQLAQEVWTNMQNLVLYDANLRNAWFYNAWRFGLVRGELILNLGIMMSALSGGAMLGTAAGTWFTTAIGATGLSASATVWFVSFCVASLVGAGVSASIVYAPDWEVGQKITAVMQNMRAWAASTNHSLTRAHLATATDGFANNRFQTSVVMNGVRHDTKLTQKYQKRYENRTRYLFGELRTQRLNYVNVYLEKYYELREQIEKAEATLAMAKEVITNTDLRKALIVKADGEYMSYDEAWEAHCKGLTRDHWCVVPARDQLQAIDKSKKIVAEGRELLEQFGDQLIQIYVDDAAFFKSLNDDVKHTYPTDIAIALKDEEINLSRISQKLGFFMGALHSHIAERRNIQFPGSNELMITRNMAKDFISKYYVPGMDEDKFLGPLKVDSNDD